MAAEVAARWAAADLTYQEVGQTAAAALPAGYRQVRRSVAAGAGEGAFTAAAAALMGWQVQARAGLRVMASAAVARPGGVVVLGIGAGPVRVNAPCRVVYVVDEPDRRGFAYGTLPGHPECGEESFLIQQRENGTVVCTITAFSRPASVLARAAGPIGRAIQDKVTARYLRALAGTGPGPL